MCQAKPIYESNSVCEANPAHEIKLEHKDEPECEAKFQPSAGVPERESKFQRCIILSEHEVKIQPCIVDYQSGSDLLLYDSLSKQPNEPYTGGVIHIQRTLRIMRG